MAAPVDVTKAQDGGIMKTILVEGSGEEHPGLGDSVKVHYVGTLAEGGEKFDSSRDRGEHFTFTLGKGQVIKGWDEGVASMRKGEKANLRCTAAYAYGEAGSPPKIPPNSALDFEVELVSWEGEDISVDKDKSIMRSTKTEGSGYDSPNDGAKVTIDLVGTWQSKTFVDKTDFSLVCGEASEVGMPEGLDKALKRMKKGEHSKITLAPKAAFGTAGSAELSIPGGAELELDVKLKDFVKEKESWQMNDDEKLAAAQTLKDRGTEFFKAGKLSLAGAKYGKIKDLLEYMDKMEGEKKEQRDSLMLAAHLNLALVHLKSGSTVEAVGAAEKALEMSPGNPKALYRKAAAHLDANDFEQAAADFRALIQADPSNKAGAAGLAKAKAAIAAEKAKAAKTFGGMFDKFAAKDKAKEAAAAASKEASPTPNGDAPSAAPATNNDTPITA